GEEAFDLVEEVRALAKSRRSDEPGAAEALQEIIANLSIESQKILVKAFSNYFQLINIAEDQQRVRILRQREHEDILTESIDDAIYRLHEAGLSVADVE